MDTVPSDAEAIAASIVDPAAFGVVFDRHATTVFRPEAERVHHIQSPLDRGGASVMINVDVVNVDELYERLLAAGARITMPIEDTFYGHRRFEADDLEGHRWHFSESFESVRARGGRSPEDDSE